MKPILLTILATGSILFFTNCNKDETDPDNWAAAVAGSYVGTITPYFDTTCTSIFTRISDKTLNLQVIQNGSFLLCLDSIAMNTATTFTIDERDACIFSTGQTTGSGLFNGQSVNYVLYNNSPNPVNFSIKGTK